jgi:hypothetical protein
MVILYSMQNRKLSLTALFIVLMLIPPLWTKSQNTECKVILPAISGTYSGDCRKGIAHGMGAAQGVDHYEGQFIKGLPQGKGVYTWADGSMYTGEWEKGLRHGEGVMIQNGSDSPLKGYWKHDKYVGKELLKSYTVERKDNLLTYSLRKVNDDGNEVIVKLLSKGQINSRVQGLNIATNNGSQFKLGPNNGIQNVYFPFNLKVTFTTYNPVSRAPFDVVFECTINEPGKWEVILNN